MVRIDVGCDFCRCVERAGARDIPAPAPVQRNRCHDGSNRSHTEGIPVESNRDAVLTPRQTCRVDSYPLRYSVELSNNSWSLPTGEHGNAGTAAVVGAICGRRHPERNAYVAVASLYCSVDRKSTRLNSSHSQISYAVFCL